jgi:ATP-dependent DNA helicase RecQ
MWSRSGGGIRLTSEVPSKALPIDWSALDRRRRTDMSKLEAVQRYAYTKGCRRGFILRYFGDPAAQSRCDGCDNCLGSRRSFDAARAPVTRRATKERKARPPVELPVEMSAGDATLLASLKSLRGRFAKEEQVPAYCVFADRTLVEMSVRRPRSLPALRDVRGVGPAKLEKYGQQVLKVIRDADGTEAA